MTDTPFKAIRRVLEYSWKDEHKDFYVSDIERARNHIFLALREVRNWLAECGEDFESYMDQYDDVEVENEAAARAAGFPNLISMQAESFVPPEECPRCGAHEQATHHPLCQERDGTPTGLSDEEVRGRV